jgi:hypothetical protein
MAQHRDPDSINNFDEGRESDRRRCSEGPRGQLLDQILLITYQCQVWTEAVI